MREGRRKVRSPMSRRTQRFCAAAFTALAVCAVVPALAQTARRPTPREAIEHHLTPLTTVTRELNLTDTERAAVADVDERAEAQAAEMVEAEHRHHARAVSAGARRIELLAQVLRARVETLRAEAQAAERERAVVEATARRTQARAALERVAEARIALDRGEGATSAWTLPTPDGDAGVAASDAGGAR